jgi:hypothetical protein
MRLLIAGGVLFAAVVSAAAPPSTILTLGILRRDAIVVPFAVYDGQHWENHWPEPTQSVDVPISLRSVPEGWWGHAGPLDSWQIWKGTAAPQLVHVRQPDWLQTHCERQVGLRTDYQPGQRPPGPDAQPYPKDGLAISPPHAVEPVEIVPPTSAEAQQLAGLLPSAFAAREEDALAQAQADGSPVRVSKKELEALPITIEAVYAAGATHRVYWVESSREIKKDNECAAIAFGAGWFVFDSGKLTSVDFDVSVVPCNRESLHYMLPLGVLTLPTGRYWIAQWSGWDEEAYDVLNLDGRTIVPALVTSGGGC